MSRNISRGQVEFQTRLVHNAHSVNQENGAVSVPIHHASTFHQFDVDSFGAYDYSRSGNPTREALEETIAQLEGGIKGFAFASGMEAISASRGTLAALPEREQLILRLRFERDMTQAEIAERIGVSQMHVSRLLRRSLERLSAAGAEAA
jgi:cystathionine beta-lyase/cystathionine gamma-synthase